MKNDFKIDFIGIGAQKAATTWIFNCLLEHPDICGPESKELHFFNKKRTPALKPNEILHDAKVKRNGIEDYKQFFERCSPSQIEGEFTPDYLYRAETPSLIKKYFPDVKLIACLRNPIERAYSHYVAAENKIDRSVSFKEAIKEDSDFIERGMYYKQLKRYYDLFPRDNILVLIYENIQKAPQQFIRNIYEFLGVDASFNPKLAEIKINPGSDKISFLSRMIHKTTPHLRRNSIGRKIKQSPLVRKIVYTFIDRPGYNKNVRSIEKEIENELQKKFEKDINKLEELINKDLSYWI